MIPKLANILMSYLRHNFLLQQPPHEVGPHEAGEAEGELCAALRRVLALRGRRLGQALVRTEAREQSSGKAGGWLVN